ncbi:MAG: hypothetical protein RSD53_10230 [Algoriella sp.]|uniref:hypothetical protein n=1 Tax=Algoriella sp. TaxID=1872434 RepID=UPI002FC8C7D1
MTTSEIIKIVIGIIASLGGGGAIVIGLSNYLGQFLAKRYEEKIKAKFQNEINEYQTQLDILKQTTIRYSDKQFEHYSKLWASLYDLKVLADELWQQATSTKLERFSRQLRLTKTEIEKASLFIEESHYKELIDTIKYFSEYQIGKSDLINYRRNNYFEDNQVQQMISINLSKKIEYEKLILVIKADLKKQIGGK